MSKLMMQDEILFDEEKRLKKGIRNDTDFLILNILKDLNGPIGSGNLTGILEDLGVNISPASIGRILSSLERNGLLEKDRNKGRMITQKGFRAMREAQNRKQVDNLRKELDTMLTGRTLQNFLMILQARKIIESATVRLAAENISEEELAELRNVLDEREEHIQKSESVSGADVEFHTLISRASGNKVLSLIYQIISRLGQQSELFEYMRKQASGPYLSHHRNIYEALLAKDPDLAENFLKSHIDELIQEVQKYWHDHIDAEMASEAKK